MLREVTIGSISWIDGSTLPPVSGWLVFRSKQDWLAKTYMGLAATANPPPPETVDFKAYRAGKQFRALMYCRFRFDVDDQTKKLKKFSVLEAIHDPGWTPPFDQSKFPSTKVLFWKKSITDSNFYQGESSPVSVIRTEARHPNSTLAEISGNEIVLVNGLVKFRAGKHTDEVGVSDEVGAPFHVPWVWCELLLTFDGTKTKLYGTGSAFPSHAWYLDNKLVKKVMQTADGALAADVDPANTRLFPIMKKGAAAAGPQSSLGSENALIGSVELHPNTVQKGSQVVFP